jgi:hypothetical protein
MRFHQRKMKFKQIREILVIKGLKNLLPNSKKPQKLQTIAETT